MGDKILEATSDTPAAQKEVTNSGDTTYCVLAWQGSSLPTNYVGMIYNKWMHSLKAENDYFKLSENRTFFSAYQKYIAHILSKKDCVVRVAVLSDNHDVCLGFSVSRGTTLYYVQVQRDQRRQGIGRSLVPYRPDIITHLTRDGMLIWATKFPQAVFNPFY